MSEVEPQETAAVPTAAKPLKAATRVPGPVKSEAITMWRTGEFTLKDIEAKTGFPLAYWKQMFSRKKIRKGEKAKEIEAKKEAALEAAITIDPAVHARRVFDTKNETYRIVELLRKLTVKTIVENQQAGRPVGAIQNDMKAIREAAAAIKTCREEAYAVLGINPDDIGDDQLPELRIEDLTQEQIEQLQLAEGETEAIVALPDALEGTDDDNDEVREGDE